MQTFLPYPNFRQSAKALDWRRLGNQRKECRQILKALETGKGWRNHPATKMWEGYESALKLYCNACIQEWVRRGYKNTLPLYHVKRAKMPPWLGNDDFHASHRAALLAKNPEWYQQFQWDEDPSIDYIWPKAS